MPQLSLHSPIGDLTVSEEDGVIVSLDWGWGAEQRASPLLLRARDALNHYFDGAPAAFEIPLAPVGTPFQRRVWAEMKRIPYGGTTSYGLLSRQLGTSARAIGSACGCNPIPIFIPCHRVLAADGRLGGYSGEGGIEVKAALLRLEGAREDASA